MGFPCFSAIARSVMISAELKAAKLRRVSFSAIARSVMISAKNDQPSQALNTRFSAIARSVMISAALGQ